MILDSILERGLFTVQRYGPGPRDALGKTTRALLTSTVVNGLLQPTGTIEGEAFVVDLFRSTMPIGTDLRADDEVLARGKRYTVEGTPFEARVPGMRSVGIVTAVLRYVGPVTP